MLQGTITAKEMLEVIGTVITMEGLNKVTIINLRQIMKITPSLYLYFLRTMQLREWNTFSISLTPIGMERSAFLSS